MNGPIQVIGQRRKRDCGVACFAMLLGKSYDDALEAIVNAVGPIGKGLFYTSLLKAAEALGKPLVKHRRYNPEEVTGILGVADKKRAHFVLLHEGLIIDPEDQTIWAFEDYLKNYGMKAHTLLTLSP